MKILKKEPIAYIHLSILKTGEKTEYVSITETTSSEVQDMIKKVIQSQNLSVFEKGLRTSVNVREYIGSKAGKCISLSFRGLSTTKTKELIIKHINSQK